MKKLNLLQLGADPQSMEFSMLRMESRANGRTTYIVRDKTMRCKNLKEVQWIKHFFLQNHDARVVVSTCFLVFFALISNNQSIPARWNTARVKWADYAD